MKNQGEFTHELIQEHIDEISSLYDIKQFAYQNTGQSWLALENIETRIDAHLDALVTSKEPAVEAVKEKYGIDLAGELYGYIALFCRQDRFDRVMEAMNSTDTSDKEIIIALQTALCNEWPSNWDQPEINELLQNPQTGSIAAKVIGFRRNQSGGDMLINSKLFTDPEFTEACLWTLGRLGNRKYIDILEPYIENDHELVSQATMLSLLRCGNQQVIDKWLMTSKTEQTWPYELIGLSGSQKHADMLINLASGKKACSEHMIALGLLGQVGAFDVLLAGLEKQEMADAAAFALDIITDAQLFEEKFIPEEIDEDVLFEDELEKLKKGESIYPPGQEPGKTIRAIVTEPNIWKQWLYTNRNRFRSNIRYRRQQPFSPGVLIEQMAAEESPTKMRKLGYEELVIRYHLDFQFETELCVVSQKKTIKAYQTWWKANQNRFQPGRWYFDTKPY